jgi:archaeoflavoprotein AfpA
LDNKKKKIAWGITGSGDRLIDTFRIMKKVKREYKDKLEIIIYLSKAGNQVVKYYNLAKDIEKNFGRPKVEVDSNTPFLAGALQLGKFEFLLIAPSTSNTTAKISMGIADTLLSNSAIMALKAFIPVYIMPSDYEEGTLVTELPNGQSLKLRIRNEDAAHTKKLAEMDDVHVLKKPEMIYTVFRKRFKQYDKM